MEDGLMSTIKTSELEQKLDIKNAPPVPTKVYESLPKILSTRCSLLCEQHRKDIFLISSLPVLAAHLPNVLAAHADHYYSPDLFTLIIAEPATGKGIASKAKLYGYCLQKRLIEQSNKARREYESLTDEEKLLKEPPKDKRLFIPANSSSRAFYDTLLANNGRGLIFENEIDTMLHATSQEWGDFSDVCRKAFHHESISINRKGRNIISTDRSLVFSCQELSISSKTCLKMGRMVISAVLRFLHLM